MFRLAERGASDRYLSVPQGSCIHVASWFPDGRRCVTGSQNGQLAQWDGTTFAYIGSNNLHAAPVRCIAWGHDGGFFLAGDGNIESKGKIMYWAPSGQFLNVRPSANLLFDQGTDS